MELASGRVYPRYTLLFLPLLMASLAAALLQLRSLCLFSIGVFVLLLLTSGGPFKTARELKILKSTQTKYLPFLQNIRTSLRPKETLVVCASNPRHGDPIYPGTVSYFASNDRPCFYIRSVEDFRKKERIGRITPPYRGLCTEEAFEELKKALDSYVIVETAHGYVHWKSSLSEAVDRPAAAAK